MSGTSDPFGPAGPFGSRGGLTLDGGGAGSAIYAPSLSLLGDDLGSIVGIPGYAEQQAASWRDLPFVVATDREAAGRRWAVHEYPFRDDAWPEDMGKLPRRFSFAAFLTGPDVLAQRARMVEAAEAPGEGELVHPVYGAMTVALLAFTASSPTERGVVELAFDFLRGGPRGVATEPSILNNTAAALGLAADDADVAVEGDWISKASTAARELAAQVQPYARAAVAAVGDAGRIVSAVAEVSKLTGFNGLDGAGRFGRYASAGSLARLVPGGQQVATAASTISNGRVAVERATGNLTRLAGRL